MKRQHLKKLTPEQKVAWYEKRFSSLARLFFNKAGNSFQTSDKRQYEVQRNGSLRVLNKPRSRVKRLREERQNQF